MNRKITAKELRGIYISFFERYGHRQIAFRSLIPENDPTVLFTTAGMHPLVPYLLGEEHPQGKRLVNCQPCIRTGDIEQVGDRTHLTFFEMLGNWSLGDYFKEESLRMSFEFLTSPEFLGIEISRLFVSVFAGDENAPRDDEAAEIWRKLGIPQNQIFALPRSDNWWGPVGEQGPCGPDSEIFYDTAKPGCSPQCAPGCSCGKYVEIWNNVFMQYYQRGDGGYDPLVRRCVDTGMGLERTAAVLAGKDSVFDTEVFAPILNAVEQACSLRYGGTESLEDRSFRIIADHIRASVMILGDPQGPVPNNLGQGYILRRLIRRAMRYGKTLEIEGGFLAPVAEAVIAENRDVYPGLYERKERILREVAEEELRFIQTLAKGERELQKILSQARKAGKGSADSLPGDLVFKLYDTYGFPLELTEELAGAEGLKVDRSGFEEAFERHREVSKKGAESSFKGGLADHSEMATRYHTATHLLHEALRQVLGEHVEQRGSNINAERMRFDFSHPKAMTKEDIARTEGLVNEQIQADLPVSFESMPLEEAKQKNARALFLDQYDSEVKVYSIGTFSLEVCGGPHVNRTGELGRFKIVKEGSSSQGIRRIKAVLTETA